MNYHRDERGVSELLGAILFFGLLVILLVLAQVSLVPTLNQQAEFEQSERVADDLAELQDSLFRVAAIGAPEQTSIEAGVAYPRVPFLVNSDRMQGTVRTLEAGELRIEGISSTNADTADYWTSGLPDVGVYETRTIQYAPNYVEFRGGITYVESPIRYTAFDGTNVVSGTQTPLISGRTITFVTVSGEFVDSSDGGLPVALSPLSAPAKTVSVIDDGSPITVTFSTRLTPGEWTEILADEIDGTNDPDNDRFVTSVTSAGAGQVTLTLEAGTTYNLRLAGVGVGENLSREAAAYVTREAGSVSIIPVNGGEVSVEVRDRYNNPVSGVPVDFEVDGTATLSAASTVTDENGLATVEVSGTVDATVEFRAFGDFDGGADTNGDGAVVDPYEEVVFDLQLGRGSDNTPDDFEEINPNEVGFVVLGDTTTYTCQPNENCYVASAFENRVGQQVTINTIRINHYSPNAPGASGEAFPGYARIVAPNGTAVGPDLFVKGERRDVSTLGSVVTIGQNAGQGSTPEFELRLRFYDEDGTPKAIPGGDAYLVTMTFVNGDDVPRATYFVSPAAPPKNDK